MHRISKVIVFLFFTVFLVGCASSDLSHKYLMRGQVVSVLPDNIIVCVGFDDGVKVGQIFNTYRFSMNNGNKEDAIYFQKVEKGQVKIEEIIDEHFAKVTVLKGTIKKHDMVQLNN